MDGAGDNAGQKQIITATTATTGTEAKEIKRKSPYVYSFGDKWPGVKIGHRECNPPRFRIPQKMGWMWKIQQPYFGCKVKNILILYVRIVFTASIYDKLSNYIKYIKL